METDNKYALVTGATSGIGLELAKLFATDHFNLVIAARDQQELSNAAEVLKQSGSAKVITHPTDLFQKDAAIN